MAINTENNPKSDLQIVTVDTFVRAETDMAFKSYVLQGAFGKFFHLRQPTPIDAQDIIRMNRDTLYSAGIFDLTQPVTIIKPDGEGRFQSMLAINQDHFVKLGEHGAGEFTLTQEMIKTRYVMVIFRTFIDANNPDDIKIANTLQDKIQAKQSDIGSFEVPNWDEKSLSILRDAINVLAATKSDVSCCFGDQDQLNPIDHLLGTAYGWGANPKETATYINVVPTENDGKTPYILTVKDVPVNGFWSITVYNEKGFMEKNELDAYSFNNVTAKPNPDGSITIHFGGDSQQINYLPIMKGWNYLVRLYQPKQEILDGIWLFPEPQPVK